MDGGASNGARHGARKRENDIGESVNVGDREIHVGRVAVGRGFIHPEVHRSISLDERWVARFYGLGILFSTRLRTRSDSYQNLVHG